MMLTISCTRIVKVHKIAKPFVTAYIRTRSVKPTWPVEPKYLNPDIIDGGPLPGNSGWYTKKLSVLFW